MKYAVPILCAVFGFLLSYLNYRISAHFLKKGTDKFFISSIFRSIISVGFLTLLFFLGEKTQNLNTASLIICGAFGISIPTVLFTGKLLKSDKGDDKLG